MDSSDCNIIVECLIYYKLSSTFIISYSNWFAAIGDFGFAFIGKVEIIKKLLKCMLMLFIFGVLLVMGTAAAFAEFEGLTHPTGFSMDTGACAGCHNGHTATMSRLKSCGRCHSFPPGKDQGTYKGSKTHTMHVTTYGFLCSTCHTLNNHNQSGVTSSADWEAKFDRANVQIEFNPALNPFGVATNNLLGTNRQCLNLYCHAQNGTINGVDFSQLGGTNQAYNIPIWDNGALEDYPTTKQTGQCGTCHDATKDNTALGGQFPSWDNITFKNDWQETANPKQVYDATEFTSIGDARGDVHKTHLDKLRGPQVLCDTCHTTPPSVSADSYPEPRTHVNFNFDFIDGSNSKNATTVCNNCHSPIGKSGVSIDDPDLGAKANWDTGVYEADGSLKTGKDKWCTICHDDDPVTSENEGAFIKGIYAPGILGDDENFGFFKNGHGLDNAQKYDKDSLGDVSGNAGAARPCLNCHDSNKNHITGENDTDKENQRLRDEINSYVISGITDVCKSCHANTQGNPSTVKVSTHGNDESGGYSKIEDASFRKDCVECHEPHGINKNTDNTKNLKMIKSKVMDNDVVFTSTTGGNSFDEADEGDTDDICATCHSNSDNPGYPTKRHQGGNHTGAGAMGEDKRGTNCTSCHSHDYKNDKNVDYADGFMPSCNGCHGYPPKEVGKDDSGNRGYAGGIGAHQVHVTGAGFQCQTCHGHNGTGSEHGGSVGRTTVLKENINLVFDTNDPLYNPTSSITFPGGTNLYNGGTALVDKITDPTNTKCTVGCHNPIIFYPQNETLPNLINQVSWNDGNYGMGTINWASDGDSTTPDIPCAKCHDTHAEAMKVPNEQSPNSYMGTTYKSSHSIDTATRNDCKVCHDMSEHKSGNVRLINNNDKSVLSWIRTLPNPDGTDNGAKEIGSICLSCHDNDGNTPFSTLDVPPDVASLWSPAAHKTGRTTNSGYGCFGSGQFGGSGCHNNPHGSSSVRLLDNTTSTGKNVDQVCFGCHTEGKVKNDSISRYETTDANGQTVKKPYFDDIQEAFNQSARHDMGATINIGTGFTLQCTSCHNPHIATGKYWEADQGVTPVTKPNFSDPQKNPRAMGTTLWGDEAGEKMVNYGNYVTPQIDVWDKNTLPNYPGFCLECHSQIVIGRYPPDFMKTIQWGSDPHGQGTAAGPDGGDRVPDWYGAGMAKGWDGDDNSDWINNWPVILRGLGEQAWTRSPYDQETRLAGGNFVLSCTDCHEAHGSNVENTNMIRPKVNVEWGSGSDIWNVMCNNCHWYYTDWHTYTDEEGYPAGQGMMGCATASCHEIDSIHQMKKNNLGSGSRTVNKNLVAEINFDTADNTNTASDERLSDTGSFRMHGAWRAGTGTTATGKYGNAIEVNNNPFEAGTRDQYWSTDDGKKGTWRISEMKYNTTLEAWVNPTNDTLNEQIVIAKQWSADGLMDGGYMLKLIKINGSYRAALIINVNGGGTYGISDPDSNGQRGAFSLANIPLNKWTHVAATFDTNGLDKDINDPSIGRIRIYVNGIDSTTSYSSNTQVYSQPAAGETYMFPYSQHSVPGDAANKDNPWGYMGQWTASPLSIGGYNWSDTSKNFIGKLDNVKVWNITKDANYFSSVDSTTAPRIDKVEGLYGGNQLRVTFSEGVYANPGQTGVLTTSDFSFLDLDDFRTIQSVSHEAGGLSATLTLNSPMDEINDIFIDTLAPVANAVYDKYDNATETDPVTVTMRSGDAPNEAYFDLNEVPGSAYVLDSAKLLSGKVFGIDTLTGGEYSGGGDGSGKYISFEYNNDALQVDRAMTIETRIKPTGIGSTNYIRRILARDATYNYQLSVWRNTSSADFPNYSPNDEVASIAFWMATVDDHGYGDKWKVALTNYASYPIVSDHWYMIKVIWNSDKITGIPADIYVDDQGTDGNGTGENWVGFVNTTNTSQSYQLDKKKLFEGDVIQTYDGRFIIGANSNNPDNNLFNGHIDYIYWKKFVQ